MVDAMVDTMVDVAMVDAMAEEPPPPPVSSETFRPKRATTTSIVRRVELNNSTPKNWFWLKTGSATR